ncbi:FKBP-type peptidyl-prolyl cis-trans isomerase [Candidatus Sulfidibacterium hydrothermale]|uniref:FKBP-type peptidyl-prolyl cis-trans isomerase n=1 Tax=Candidatus Sulfidibacterium hydrothermale TaxID=2875962 RepID=UPI001F0AE3F7|nr:FKBP-type peptidyl-prolyl cis-trans isomerase [Candidatus Sulfidibacterium hydrothermale]UBM61283.1 FKBP-type peptidyl-prolyl cis-trans isomerase [Candidatus Sulfidibacterium hydrothermale]
MCKIEKGKKAKVTYTLTVAGENEIIDQADETRPATFSFGKGQLIDGFEKNLTGLKPGDSFDFIIKAQEAYGPRDSYAVFDIPKDTFAVDGKVDEKILQVGNTFPMRDNNGNRHVGKIIQINENSVTMDFNHPLAGKDLHFRGKVLEVFD